ncbi:phage baseplate assembly protein W [Allocatelliglobosispora scoriae]|uniref:Phage baseplate assembly protein W n=1 Tax=Allocatelliglobosispora scoriae TaxID=643052 RepID=A0A841BZN7_9ACTN|nr:GPW/gp25 family protein [Allocatelliglobosispora scoriae]MBB5872958.1 phage baseplate assembly protein W [Allocatelliglobosispora scoriae]
MTASSLRFSGADGVVTTATGRLAMVHGDEAIRQAIMLLLGTVPGERLMRPDYGSHLHRLLFAPNDQTTAGLAIHYVRQALARWEPRVEVEEVDADPDPDIASRLNIHLRYRVKQTLTVDTLDYPLALGDLS